MFKNIHKNLGPTWRLLALFSLLLIVSLVYVWTRHSCAKTNDARVMTNIVPIASTVNGVVTHVKVHENEHVKEGQLLFELSSDDIRHNLLDEQARLSVLKQSVESLRTQLQTAKNELMRRESVLTEYRKEYTRNKRFYADHGLTKEELDHSSNDLENAITQSEEQKQLVSKMQYRLEHYTILFREAEISLTNAKAEMKHLVVTAPVSGYISNFNLHVGSIIKEYRTLFGIIQPSPVWVIANFLESDLVKIRPGQRAKVRIDMYPGHNFFGQVESIGYGVALDADEDMNHVLPTVSPNHFWTRLSQRFPVRIRLRNTDQEHFPMRVGANAKVNIRTRG